MPVGYYTATDILPEKVCAEVCNQLGHARKVTFGASGTPLNKTEKLLAEPLVHKIRAHLDKKGIHTRRIFWFGRRQSKYGDMPVAKELLEMGYPIMTVALAMGFSYVTLYRWGLDASVKGNITPEIYIDYDTAVAIGKARFAQVGKPSYGRSVSGGPGSDIVGERKAASLALLGQCVVALEAIRERENAKVSEK